MSFQTAEANIWVWLIVILFWIVSGTMKAKKKEQAQRERIPEKAPVRETVQDVERQLREALGHTHPETPEEHEFLSTEHEQALEESEMTEAETQPSVLASTVYQERREEERLKALEHMNAIYSTAPRNLSRRPNAASQLFTSAASLRDAIVIKEILERPKWRRFR